MSSHRASRPVLRHSSNAARTSTQHDRRIGWHDEALQFRRHRDRAEGNHRTAASASPAVRAKRSTGRHRTVRSCRRQESRLKTRSVDGKLKILIVTQYFWPESFRINDLALGLRDRGHDVTVL